MEKTKIIFGVHPTKGMFLKFVAPDGKETEIVRGVDFREFNIQVFADKPFAIPYDPEGNDIELLSGKPEQEIKQMYEIFK